MPPTLLLFHHALAAAQESSVMCGQRTSIHLRRSASAALTSSSVAQDQWQVELATGGRTFAKKMIQLEVGRRAAGPFETQIFA
ncbi:MAG: hypothetical protein M1823_000709 [Watsoniomyces obsoletus]|nr:MAG: hypothetical protein M1823_000709 [Watsoniomyces obsoletus]